MPALDRAAIIGRIAKLGLRNQADALRERIRKRCLTAGDSKAIAMEAAWAGMWENFESIVESLEAKAVTTSADTLRGCPADLTGLLDPSYSETDPGKRLRDGLLWTAENIRLVVIDSPDVHTTIDLARASTPPPMAWAVFVLECYARRKPEDRGELIAKVMPFAAKTHDPQRQRGGDGEEQDGFLGVGE